MKEILLLFVAGAILGYLIGINSPQQKTEYVEVKYLDVIKDCQDKKGDMNVENGFIFCQIETKENVFSL